MAAGTIPDGTGRHVLKGGVPTTGGDQATTSGAVTPGTRIRAATRLAAKSLTRRLRLRSPANRLRHRQIVCT